MKIGSINQSSEQISTFQHLFQDMCLMYGFLFLTARLLKMLQMTRNIFKYSSNLSVLLKMVSVYPKIFWNLILVLLWFQCYTYADGHGLIFYCFVQFTLCFTALNLTNKSYVWSFFRFFLHFLQKMRFVTSY